MRKILLGMTLLALAVPAPARAATNLLTVADGQYFYDSTDDGACNADTNDYTLGVATRHWHVGVPLIDEPIPDSADGTNPGGFGCLGKPKSWTVTVPAGSTATISGTIDYTWDQDVPGGCCNDVHLHVFDATGVLVTSTLQTEGPKPVVPMVAQVQHHDVNLSLAAGTYTLREDIFSGEHTAWLTNITVDAS